VESEEEEGGESEQEKEEEIKKVAKSIKVSKKHLQDAVESDEEEEEEQQEEEKPKKKTKEEAMKALAELAVSGKKKSGMMDKIAKAEKEAKKIGTTPNKMMSAEKTKKATKKRKAEESSEEEEEEKVVKKSKTASGKAKKVSTRSKKGEEKPKKSKKIERLSSKDALIKYRARLSTISEEDFAELDGCWISVYEPTLKEKVKFEEGIFPFKWTKVLAEVASEKGATILGVIPHYGKGIENSGNLKFFKAMPQIVEKDLVTKYKKAGMKGVEGKRVYVGKTVGAGREKQSDFAMMAQDNHNDAFWQVLQEVLEASDSDSDEQ